MTEPGLQRHQANVPTTCRPTRSAVLAAVREPYGRPRFYRPFEHPATYRWRWTLAKLNSLPYDPPDETVEYIERKLAEFEAGEARAKQIHLIRMRERHA